MSRRSAADRRRRAAELGVIVRYEDVDKVIHDAPDEVLARVVDVLEADRADTTRSIVAGVHVHRRDASTIVVPVRRDVTDASVVVDGVRTSVGPTGRPNGGVPLPDLPVGCHTLVVESGSVVEECTVVVPPARMPGLADDRSWSSLFLPAYALWEHDDPLPSFAHLRRAAERIGRSGLDMLATLPLYATFLDQPFDPSPYSPISRLHWNEVYLPDALLPDADPVPALGDVVDWRLVGARRRRQLIEAARLADAETVDRLARFVAADPDVGAYARFMTGRDGTGDPIVERSHVLGQLLCDEQLGEISSTPGAAQLSLDLPIGSHPDGYEKWAHPALFADDIAVGAPPDTFFREGQNWGFPPQLPGRMHDTGYALWRQMIERAGRHAAMLRIDHVMAVHRLWWVPDGLSADRGVYVRYPHDELLAVIAATAAVADVAVVGENLGTVPPEVETALEEFEMLGMFEEQFTTHDDELAEIPARSVSGVRTHDMAAFAEHVATTDLQRYIRNLGAARGAPVTDLLDAVLERLAASDARMIVVDLDDLLDERRPHNLPGRVVPGIWQRRLDRPATEVFADDRVQRRLDIVSRRTP